MIQTTISDGRGGDKILTEDDPQYWEGPYHYEPYPKQLFRSTGPEEQAWEAKVVLGPDRKTAKGEKLGSDWFETPDEAKTYQRKLDQDIAIAAAEVNTAAQRMTAKAQAELKAVDDASDEHVVDVKPTKRAYKRRVKAVVAQ